MICPKCKKDTDRLWHNLCIDCYKKQRKEIRDNKKKSKLDVIDEIINYLKSQNQNDMVNSLKVVKKELNV